MDQVDQYNPPPNPAKETDSRAADYIERFGESSWELDALDPPVIDALVAGELDSMINQDRWGSAKDHEDIRRNLLNKVSLNWPEIEDFLRSM